MNLTPWRPDPSAGGWGGDERAVAVAAADRMDAWIETLKKFASTVDDKSGTLNGLSPAPATRRRGNSKTPWRRPAAMPPRAPPAPSGTPAPT